MKSEQEAPEKTRFERWRFFLLYGIVGFVFCFYAYRLFNLQIINGFKYVAQALENRTIEISIPTQRGSIYDRNGIVLAQNIPSYNVVITPALLPGDTGSISGQVAGSVQAIYRQLSQLIGVPVSNGTIDKETVSNFTPCGTELGITQIVIIGDTNSPYDPIRIKCNVDSNTAMIVREKESDWPGVSIEVEPVRDYPTGELTSAVVGFLGPVPATLQDYYISQGFVLNRDKVGYAGIENTMQDVLGGKNGSEQMEVDVAGQELGLVSPPVDPVPGDNVVLTIDTRLQTIAETALKQEIDDYNRNAGTIKSTTGVVIAINPKTGEILSLVSYPSYENNRMARVIPSYYYNQLKQDPTQPLFDQAISAELPPGSVFKIAAAIGALNEGVVTPDYQVEDKGSITITEKYYANDPGTPRTFYNWNRAGEGMVDFLHGLAWSDDVYFYKIGGGYNDEVPNGGLGIWRLSEYAKALGYGSITGIELPGEAAGLIPDPTWKRQNLSENWSTGDTYIATIGQGYVLATPLQVLDSYVTVINNGKLMKPTLIKEITNSQGQVIKPFQPEMLWDITQTPMIHTFDGDVKTDEVKAVQPWVIQMVQQGLHMVTHLDTGTAYATFGDDPIDTAGKTGTAEYCDNIAQAAGRCLPNAWPAHAWYVGYAPFDNPEIAVVAFVYNGNEGATVAAPIVRKVIDAYFELKAIDAGGQSNP
jgi:penicillin-binding protein 2